MTKKIIRNTTKISCSYGMPVNDIQEWLDKLFMLKVRLPICVITNWTYWDIKYPQKDIEELTDKGFLPAAIFSENILWDEQNRWPVGSCIKSTWLKHFEYDCIFHTNNTSYLLVGHGMRCTIEPSIFNGIYF